MGVLLRWLAYWYAVWPLSTWLIAILGVTGTGYVVWYGAKWWWDRRSFNRMTKAKQVQYVRPKRIRELVRMWYGSLFDTRRIGRTNIPRHIGLWGGLGLAIMTCAGVSWFWQTAIGYMAIPPVIWIGLAGIRLSYWFVDQGRIFVIATLKEIAAAHLPTRKGDGGGQPGVTVTRWANMTTPLEIVFEVGANFNQKTHGEQLLRQINLLYGQHLTWVEHVSYVMEEERNNVGGTDTHQKVISGFDPNTLTFRIASAPPIPSRAYWRNEYLFHPAISPRFFPLGIGIQGGVELLNEVTGEIEVIHGLDLAGEMTSYAQAAGTSVGQVLSVGAQPHVLIAGVTGSGKAVADQAPIAVWRASCG